MRLLWNNEKSLELTKNYDDLEENVKKREFPGFAWSGSPKNVSHPGFASTDLFHGA